MKVYRKLATFRDTAPGAPLADRWKMLSSWVFRVAHTTMIDHLRAADVRPRSVASIERAREYPDSHTWARIERHSVDNAAHTEGLANVGIDGVRAALAIVRARRPEYHDLLVRSARGVRPYEMVGIHGATRAAVKSRAIRARRMLREALAQVEGGHDDR